ncbi:Ammonium transporter Rh type B-B [Chionoecetes opilio]|nr:Ammonium transporter Rh type B-B [Chionoecetes opilio]
MATRLRIHDTCGVHNLHGMPGILAGIIGVIAAAVASESSYGPSLYEIFPSRAPVEGSVDLDRLHTVLPGLEAGAGYSGAQQALHQLYALLITLAIAIIGGIATGLVLRLKPFMVLKTEELYEDEKWWIMEEEEEEGHKGSVTIPMADNGAR